jgi:hypothetical protein
MLSFTMTVLLPVFLSITVLLHLFVSTYKIIITGSAGAQN